MTADDNLGERFGFQRAVEKLRGEDVLAMLISHSRSGIGPCACGGHRPGVRYSRHVADVLAGWLEAEAAKIYGGAS